MKKMANLISGQLPTSSNKKIDAQEYAQRRIDVLNSTPGKLKNIDCPICRNKGVVYSLDPDGYEVCRACECMPARRSWQQIERSGLKDVMKRYTLDTYQITQSWQETIAKGALEYCQKPEGWFFVGGRPGSGKTHICTAIVGQMLKDGKSALYVPWKKESAKLKSVLNDLEYTERMTQLEETDVLYIDDFFRTGTNADGNKTLPTQGDINLAYEIINNRYNGSGITIISSELRISEILRIDEAIGSRILERSKGHLYSMGTGDHITNMRLEGDNYHEKN